MTVDPETIVTVSEGVIYLRWQQQNHTIWKIVATTVITRL